MHIFVFRPNRRVNVHASYLEYNESADNEKENEPEDESLDDFLNDVDENVDDDDGLDDFVPDLGSKTSLGVLVKKDSPARKKSRSDRKLQKRKKSHNWNRTCQKSNEENAWDTSISYALLKDSVCVACSKEIEKSKAKHSKDLFNDKTKAGTSLYDIFTTAIDEKKVSQNDYGRRICNKCYLLLEEIEFYYLEWSSLVDCFRDTFIMGQKNLDLDFGGEVIADNDKGQNEKRMDNIQHIDMCKDAVVKIITNDSMKSFRSEGVGVDDFCCR